MKAKAIYNEFVEEVKTKFPEVAIELADSPSRHVDYFLEIRVPSDKQEEATEFIAHLSNQFYMKHQVRIFGLVLESEPASAKA